MDAATGQGRLSVTPADSAPPLGPARRRGWRALGTACLAIGTISVFVPLLPTTVFWIIAMWVFSKPSPQSARRLLAHPRYGPGFQG